jgi:predicted nicotinamide N-methyase|nr:methyltransferase domain-containing protein [Kofleriaceae bacterium]
MPTAPATVATTHGDVPLDEVELELAGRTWRILHAGAVISREQEEAYLRGDALQVAGETGTTRLPYGSVLWPSAIALAHELATRDLRGLRVLELGAGTGLPGIIAASRGARVVQTDRQSVALHLSKRNAERNGVAGDAGIETRTADWTAWTDDTRYDLVIGADILYARELHAPLRAIFERNAGEVLVADPYRANGLALLEAMERDGWRASLTKWTVGVTPPPRPVGVFALRR